MAAVLEVTGLKTSFATQEGAVKAVGGVDFSINKGETLGVVGESGSGKSQIFMSIMGLLARNGSATGSVKFQGEEILGLDVQALNRVRGAKMAMIFQDPMTSLNPYLSVRRQMTEVLIQHKGLSEDQAAKQSAEMLEKVQIPEAKRRLNMYPHEFSGGMRQRVMIAMALLCGPELLIADEPTTALDVTVQAQILEVLVGLQRDFGMAIALITHDLGVIARMADRVMVMYAGNIVEKGSVRDLFKDPQHPYTQGLLESMPRLDETEETRLMTIGGQPPNLQNLPSGCSFRDRCRYAFERCPVETPLLTPFAEGRSKACHLPSL
ncbi:ABC transporter ATP-binding protein [Dongia sedimenti]|uniref:ABC transporter ATP-binding protein n=1 Tax=Dongia sedimenti TaxID=3064282 RepID=A0ABU0YK43_9PROT|nr:ABC transporter ATP-binding protein [Rhodospirillaceae bacterium R-7]